MGRSFSALRSFLLRWSGVRNHGRTPGKRQPCDRSACEQVGHRRSVSGFDSNFWYHLRRLLQPRRHHRRCLTGWNRLVGSASLYCCPDGRCSPWSGRGAHHVRDAAVLLVLTRAVGGAQLCGASSSLPSDCSRSFGDALALGPQQSPLPWERILLRCIGSRLRLHLPIPRLHWPALPATPLPGFVLLTLPASWWRN